MYLDSNDRRPAMSPKLALRVALIGGFALAMFAIVFFRLWYLQVLSGDRYLAKANDNQVREIKVQAPRGEILDRNGEVLVENTVGLAVKVTPDGLPPRAPRARRSTSGSSKRAQREAGRDRRAGRRAVPGAPVLGRHRGAGRQARTSSSTSSRTATSSPG